jgi:lipopolysaccharide export system protein LptA
MQAGEDVGALSTTLSTSGTGAFTTDTVTHAGSGLVFTNTYSASVTTAFHNAIIAAETYLESHFTNSVTLNVSFDLQTLNPVFSAQDSFPTVAVTYGQLVNALQSHATSPDDTAAVNALQLMDDPSGGQMFTVPNGQAKLLGLPGTTNGTDESIVLNSLSWTDTSITANPGDAIAVLIHELTRGAMGRIGGLWGPMDLFRYTASGQLDDTGGQDGQPTYFSPNGQNINTGLQFHNPINDQGQDDGFDWADWDQVGQDVNATDPFGPGGPGAGDPGTLSATDLQIMDVLGWTLESPPSLTGTVNAAFTEKQPAVTLSPSVTVADPDTTLASATVKITGGTFAGDGDVLATSTAGTTITASYNSATEMLVLTGNDTLADYQTVLDKVTFSSSSGNPTNFGSNPTRTVTWTVNDGITSSAVMTILNIIPVNDAPTVASAATVVSAHTGQPLTVSPTLALADPDSLGLTSATVKVTGGTFAGDGDVLSATTTGTAITASYNSATETLILTGNDTLAHYQSVLDSVVFKTTPTPGVANQQPTRTLTWSVNDGASQSAIATTTIAVVPVKTDFNDDLHTDILFQDVGNDALAGTPQVWLMNGTSVVSQTTLSNPGSNWIIAGTGDFNQDGNADIVLRDTVAGTVKLWEMNGASVALNATVATVATNWTIIGLADFNGDGRTDLLWRNTAGDVGFWLMNGPSILGTGMIGNPGTNWTIVGTGDFNGDGKADLLWRNTAGDLGFWEMNGTSILATGMIGNPGTNWTPIGTGDFNGDGKTDILWHDTAGNMGVWEMNGTSVLAAAGMGTRAPVGRPWVPVTIPAMAKRTSCSRTPMARHRSGP